MVNIVSDQKPSQTRTLSFMVVKNQNQTKKIPKKQQHLANPKSTNNKKITVEQAHICFIPCHVTLCFRRSSTHKSQECSLRCPHLILIHTVLYGCKSTETRHREFNRQCMKGWELKWSLGKSLCFRAELCLLPSRETGGGWGLQMPSPMTRVAPRRKQLQSNTGHEKQEHRIRECICDPASAL